LAAGVAHEIGNPLNSLNIHLQLLTRSLDRIEDEELRAETEELLNVAAGEIKRLDSIVANFLRAVRPVPLAVVELDVKRLLTEVLEFMRAEIEARRVLVEAAWADDVPSVSGDVDQLKQACYNLIKNAVQAMSEGGVLRVGCKTREDFLEVSFADTGGGLTPEELGQMFEPYYTTKPGGTGLGLLIVERIVRSHGGELGIETAPGTGTVFTIRLPLRDRRVRLLQPPIVNAEAHEVRHEQT